MYKKIEKQFWAAPQISIEDIKKAHEEGVTHIVNNRPDGEDPEQPQGDEVEKIAQEFGIRYSYIPISHGGFSELQIKALHKIMQEIGRDEQGRVLAYCRSGTRSTFLWALMKAKNGVTYEELARLTGNQGYDITPLRAMIDMLAVQYSEME